MLSVISSSSSRSLDPLFEYEHILNKSNKVWIKDLIE